MEARKPLSQEEWNALTDKLFALDEEYPFLSQMAEDGYDFVPDQPPPVELPSSEKVAKFNPNHDERGRFTFSSDGPKNNADILPGWQAQSAAFGNPDNYAAIQKEVGGYLKDQGFPADKIEFDTEQAVGELGTEIAHYEPGTGKMVVHLQNVQPGDAKGIASHELEHAKFHEWSKQAEAERVAWVADMRSEKSLSPDAKESDVLALPMSEEAHAKYPNFAVQHDFNFYQAGYDAQKLTDYAQANWVQALGHKISAVDATNESLAEIAHLRMQNPKFVIPDSYNPLWNSVNSYWSKSHPAHHATRTPRRKRSTA